jgi:2-polyprenyl-3-methyl-5-hydroxy-6-metoxy-1,4-benzoquinol methylase
VYQGSGLSTVDVPDDDAVGCAALEAFGTVDGARLLDLGCGGGEYSRFFAGRGARVTAVDQSEVAISALRDDCGAHSLNTITPVVADAFEIERLGPFDFVFGSMILHHLEPFDAFVGVLARSMAPGGVAFFYENSAMSQTLVWSRTHLVGRFGIPKHGDDEEFPLEPREIDELRREFDVRVTYPELLFTRLISSYVLRGHGERLFGAIDAGLFRFERARKLSYRQYLVLRRGTSSRR